MHFLETTGFLLFITHHRKVAFINFTYTKTVQMHESVMQYVHFPTCFFITLYTLWFEAINVCILMLFYEYICTLDSTTCFLQANLGK
jgi:hypothetical protein